MQLVALQKRVWVGWRLRGRFGLQKQCCEKQRKLPREVLDALRKLIDGLRKHNINVVEVYVFGSRVRGDWMKHSDIDVVLISPDFRRMKFLERLDPLERIQWMLDIHPHIDALPYTPEEFSRALKSSIVLKDARRYWVKLRPRDI